jgi:hypothetical protein
MVFALAREIDFDLDLDLPGFPGVAIATDAATVVGRLDLLVIGTSFSRSSSSFATSSSPDAPRD